MPSSALGQPSRTLYSVQMLHVDIFQTITDTLVYLQHLLHKVTKQQNNSETNINNTLATLTAQLQQLMQLVSTSQLSPPVMISSPAAPYLCVQPKFLSLPDFHGDQSAGQAFLNSCVLYICLVPVQPQREKSTLGPYVMR